MSNVAISKKLDTDLFRGMTIRQHRIYLGHKLLEPITARDREELVQLVTSVVGRLAVHFVGDEK